MEKIKLGIVGIGNMGSAHLSCVANGKVEGLFVTAVCDIDGKKCQTAREKFPHLQTFSAYEEMLKNADMDAVLIATPHPFHGEMAMAALKSGRHVMLEKPVDITVSQAKRLNEVARDRGKVFGIMFNQRTNSLFQKAKEIVAGGELGELKRSVWVVTNWYRTQSYYDSGSWRATWAGEGGGVLLNQAPHNLDLWQWICGMPSAVTAYCNVAKYHNIEVEDEATIYTEYENGATGVFITSTGDYPGTNRLEISGTKGKLVIENGVLKHWQLVQNEREVCCGASEGFVGIPQEYREYPAEQESGHKGILENFVRAIREGEPLLAPGTEGIRELTISNAAYLSQWQGNRRVRLPFDCREFDRLLAEKAAGSRFKESGTSQFSASYNQRWKVRW